MLVKYNERGRVPTRYIIEGPDGCGKSTLCAIIGNDLQTQVRRGIGTKFDIADDIDRMSHAHGALDRSFLFSDLIYRKVKKFGRSLIKEEILEDIDAADNRLYSVVYEMLKLRKEEIRFIFLLDQIKIEPKDYKTADEMKLLHDLYEPLRLTYERYALHLVDEGFEVFIMDAKYEK